MSLLGTGCAQAPQIKPTSTSTITQTSATQTYSNNLFSVKYPSEAQVKEKSNETIDIALERGHIEIGTDIMTASALPAPTPNISQDQLDAIPKDEQVYGYQGKIESALYYKTGDIITEAALKKIQESIQLKYTDAAPE